MTSTANPTANPTARPTASHTVPAPAGAPVEPHRVIRLDDDHPTGDPDVITTPSARMAHPVRRTVRTRSGSRYRIQGRRLRKLEQFGEGTDFILVDIRGDRLRYTDGERLFISSPMVSSRCDPA
jgi:hypothetical protein